MRLPSQWTFNPVTTSLKCEALAGYATRTAEKMRRYKVAAHNLFVTVDRLNATLGRGTVRVLSAGPKDAAWKLRRSTARRDGLPGGMSCLLLWLLEGWIAAPASVITKRVLGRGDALSATYNSTYEPVALHAATSIGGH